MANRAYNRSAKREREVVNRLRQQGYEACRSAGSKSPWDCWGYNPNLRHAVRIQIKTKKGARKLKISTLRDQDCRITDYWYSYE